MTTAHDTTRLRVLHLRNADIFGGPERLILNQCRRASPDVHMTVASFVRHGTKSPLLETLKSAGIDTVAIPQRGSYDRTIVRWLRTWLQDHPQDVLVGHDYKANLIARQSGRGIRVRKVALVHGYTAENWKIRVFESLDRKSLKRFDAVIAVSEALAMRLERDGMRPGQLHCVENAIDVDEVAGQARADRLGVRTSLGVEENDVVVLSLGRLSPEKGHAVLVDAIGLLHAREPFLPVRLVLVGEGVERARLERSAREVGIDAMTTFAGWRKDAAACLGAADIFALPSHREGLPLAVLEAMAARRAIVASRVGGIPAALDHGAAGVMVPPGDARALASSIERLVKEGIERENLGDAAWERVLAHYDAAGQAQTLEALYRAVATPSAG